MLDWSKLLFLCPCTCFLPKCHLLHSNNRLVLPPATVLPCYVLFHTTEMFYLVRRSCFHSVFLSHPTRIFLFAFFFPMPFADYHSSCLTWCHAYDCDKQHRLKTNKWTKSQNCYSFMHADVLEEACFLKSNGNFGSYRILTSKQLSNK